MGMDGEQATCKLVYLLSNLCLRQRTGHHCGGLSGKVGLVCGHLHEGLDEVFGGGDSFEYVLSFWQICGLKWLLGEVLGQSCGHSEEAVLQTLLMFFLSGSFLALAFALAFAFRALIPLLFALSAFPLLFGVLLLRLLGLVALHGGIRPQLRVLL